MPGRAFIILHCAMPAPKPAPKERLRKMPSSQKLILDAIEAGVTSCARRGPKNQLILVADYRYTNEGILRSYTPGLDLVGQLRFMFSTNDARFSRIEETVPFATVTYGREREPMMIPAVKSTIPELVDAVVNYLRGDS